MTDQKAAGYQIVKEKKGRGQSWRLINQSLRHGLISEQDANPSLLMNRLAG